MADPNSPSAPAADVRQALFVDIEQFLKHDKSPPRTIREVAAGDDFLSALAQSLIDAVGGCAAIDELHGRPHIDHDFDWAGIGLDDRPRVEELLRLTTSDTPVPRSSGDKSMFEVVGLDRLRQHIPWCDPEYRTIARRLLRTLALDPARALDRRIAPQRLARGDRLDRAHRQ